MKFIKLHVLFIFLFVQLTYGWAQEGKTFQIISNGNISNIHEYETAIQEADIENYRCRTVSDTLHFDNGVSFILFSAEQLKQQGMLISIQHYKNPEERISQYRSPVFRLSPEGILLALYPKQKSKS